MAPPPGNSDIDVMSEFYFLLFLKIPARQWSRAQGCGNCRPSSAMAVCFRAAKDMGRIAQWLLIRGRDSDALNQKPPFRPTAGDREGTALRIWKKRGRTPLHEVALPDCRSHGAIVPANPTFIACMEEDGQIDASDRVQMEHLHLVRRPPRGARRGAVA